MATRAYLVRNMTWNLYLEKTAAQRRLMAGVQTVFENSNMSEWVEKLHACKTVSAVNKLMAAFETADIAARHGVAKESCGGHKC